LTGKDYAEIDPAEVYASLGLDMSVPAQIAIDKLREVWGDSSYFDDPANLAKIDWAAVQANADQQGAQAQGQANIMAEALARGITVDTMAPVGVALAAGTTGALAASTIGADTGAAAASSINSPEGAAKWQGAGGDAYSQWRNGWDAAAAGWLIPPPGTASGLPPASGFGGGGAGSTTPFAGATGGVLTQMPGATRSGNRNAINVTINGVSNPAVAGRFAKSGLLDALRARGQV
jgi:hypothetical protein